MSTFVLIHGAFHGGWCWYKIVAALERKGHTVVAPDLPGNGREKTPLAQATLKSYSDFVCGILDAQPEPVVLVGHSMGGLSITQAAEGRPDKIRRLVYLTAMLPRNGETLADIIEQGEESAISANNFVVSGDGSYATFRGSAQRETFYNDCSDEDVALARLSLTPQALAPFGQPVSLSAERYGRVSRVYIECLRDHALTPETQKRLYTAVPCQQVIALQTSHSPFFSAAEELAAHLSAL